MKTMKAIVMHSYGNPEVLKYENIECPTIKNSDQILIRIHNAGVSPFDCHVRDGWYKDSSSYSLPLILGWELSGEVIAIGKNVSKFQIGDAVFGHPSVYRNGEAYAEYVVVNETEIAKKPQSITHQEACAISMNGLTAWQALFDVAHLTANQKILIHAASGGVGHIAVQLAKWRGAYVIGTASNKNKEFLLNLGVDEFIDYQTTPFETVLENIDIVFDTIGGETLKKSFLVTKKSGMIVSIVDFKTIKEAENYGIRGETVVVAPNSQQLSELAKLLEENNIKVHIEKIFPIAEAASAHRLVETGHVHGKVILTCKNI